MYPVPRLANQIISEWAEELASYFGGSVEAFRKEPTGLLSFPHKTVRVELMDGSSVEFKYAFFLVSETKNAIAVFTEHCGHHVFPFHESKVFFDGTLSYEQGA